MSRNYGKTWLLLVSATLNSGTPWILLGKSSSALSTSLLPVTNHSFPTHFSPAFLPPFVTSKDRAGFDLSPDLTSLGDWSALKTPSIFVLLCIRLFGATYEILDSTVSTWMVFFFGSLLVFFDIYTTPPFFERHIPPHQQHPLFDLLIINLM